MILKCKEDVCLTNPNWELAPQERSFIAWYSLVFQIVLKSIYPVVGLFAVKQQTKEADHLFQAVSVWLFGLHQGLIDSFHTQANAPGLILKEPNRLGVKAPSKAKDMSIYQTRSLTNPRN